jgi:hypothetical protein
MLVLEHIGASTMLCMLTLEIVGANATLYVCWCWNMLVPAPHSTFVLVLAPHCTFLLVLGHVGASTTYMHLKCIMGLQKGKCMIHKLL